jgi:hypothetical protein
VAGGGVDDPMRTEAVAIALNAPSGMASGLSVRGGLVGGQGPMLVEEPMLMPLSTALLPCLQGTHGFDDL